MAGLMTAPMIVIELALMRSMYANKALNGALIAVAVVAGTGFFGAIRAQGAVSDRQFLKSMIRHHAGAILMCERASIEAPKIQKLCKNIVASQQSEIDEMKRELRDSPDVACRPH